MTNIERTNNLITHWISAVSNERSDLYSAALEIAILLNKYYKGKFGEYSPNSRIFTDNLGNVYYISQDFIVKLQKQML